MHIQMPVDFDKHVYHFTTAEIALLYILPNLQLKFSSPSNTNDPSENKGFGYYYIFEELNAKENEGRKLFREYLEKQIKILCFSTDYLESDGETNWFIGGLNHPSMWAHYAGRYSGVCLVFNKKLLLDVTPKEKYFFGKVGYHPKLSLPKISADSFQKAPEKTIEKYVKDNIKKLFFTKHFHWSIEHELRILQFGSDNYLDISKAIVGLYIGKNFNKNQMACLKKSLPQNCWLEKVDFYEGQFISVPEDFYH